VLFAVVAAALLASNAFAVAPSPRAFSRMVFDQKAREVILFGGVSAFDPGTQRGYDGQETWAWTGALWTQRFPKHNPPARTAQTMAYDSLRGRVVMFGGRQLLGTAGGEIKVFGDMWVYGDNDWTEIHPPALPPARHLAAMTYDPIRDRIILYGGVSVGADGVTAGALYDTWEFDGTTWRQINNDQIKTSRGSMVYDKARNQVVMLGTDADVKPHMYRLDAEAGTWIELTPEKMPDCVSDVGMVYQDHNATVMATGGECLTNASFAGKTWEWNGSTWAEITTNNIARGNGIALAYDSLRYYAIMFGGIDSFTGKPRSTTTLYRNFDWIFHTQTTRPAPRSLFSFSGDPGNKTVWLLGGLDEYTTAYQGDFWGYRGGSWFVPNVKDKPSTCEAPLSAFDTDRNKLIFACWAGDTKIDVYEFDGATAAFTHVATTKSRPDLRKQSALVYDPTLKKTILFGGFDGSNFRDDTWLWDGSNWTEVKKDKPPNRSLHAMWYDPLQKKTILYGGIGREDIDHRVDRFSDMWAFNGSGWTKLSVTATPGARLGPQYAVDGAGKILLFGGLKSELTDPTKETSRIQYYDNETWQWDGAANTWTKLSPSNVPFARENGRMAFDPSTNRIMLFAGYAGHYYSDVWYWTGSNWEPLPEATGRRRPSGAGTPQTPTTGSGD
jgi:hypothetical protein